MNRPCSIVRRSASTTVDAYGNDIPAEVTVATVCELQQRRSDEADTQGETADTYWRLFFPAGTAISTGDVVAVDGERYEMFGDPWRARNPRTRLESHIEADARRTAGADDEVGS